MKSSTFIAAAAFATFAGAAHADLAATFGFTDMGANWDSSTSVLTIAADESGAISTSGDITNYLGDAFPTTALFNS